MDNVKWQKNMPNQSDTCRRICLYLSLQLCLAVEIHCRSKSKPGTHYFAQNSLSLVESCLLRFGNVAVLPKYN